MPFLCIAKRVAGYGLNRNVSERNHAMEQKKIKMKEMLIGLCLVALLAWVTFHFLFKKHSMEILQETFVKADIRYVMLGFLCMLVFISCEAANIRLLMRTFQKKVPVRRSLSYASAGFYFSAITPSATGGQPMQLYYMVRDGFGFAQSSFTLLTMAAVYQMTVLIYGSFMVAANFSFVMAQGTLIRWLLVFGILVNGICSCSILLIILNSLLAERAAMGLVRILSGLRIIRNRKKMERKVERLIDEYSRGGAYIRQYPFVIARLFLRVFIQLSALFLVPYFSGLALGISVSPGGFLAMQAVLSLAVTAVPLPGSVGASEGSFMALYSSVLGTGQAFTVMALSRGISFYGLLVITGLVTAVLQFSKKQHKIV